LKFVVFFLFVHEVLRGKGESGVSVLEVFLHFGSF
jgi:hypothetical protein